MTLKDITNLFSTQLDNMPDVGQKLNQTVKSMTKDVDFSPLGIESYKSLYDSVYESTQSFRNVFNSNIKPNDIAQLSKNGLTKELSKIIGNNDLSDPFGMLSRPQFNKTQYTYRESEGKLRTPNLNLNMNPLNIFSKFIEREIRGRDDKSDKKISEFYTNLNRVRRQVFDTNTHLYDIITDIIEIHNKHDIRRFADGLVDIFSGSTIYDDIFTINQQIKSMSNVVLDYVIEVKDFIDFIQDKEAFEILVAQLEEARRIMMDYTVNKELNYAYEDLKNLRKINHDTRFVEL